MGSRLVALLLTILLGSAVLAPLHLAHRHAGLWLSMRGQPYGEADEAAEFLRRESAPALAAATTDEDKVHAAILWLHTRMRLVGRIVNHPNPVAVMHHGGICGQFSSALVQLMRATGYEARQVLVNWTGTSASHVMTEVRIRGRWVGFDPTAFGGLAFPRQRVVTHVMREGRGLSVAELYASPDLLPAENAFGTAFFRGGRAFKVEQGADYQRLTVTPQFLYGRDWPRVDVAAAAGDGWLYDAPPPLLHDVAVWRTLPYFVRTTFWVRGTPVVLHFELFPLALLVSVVLVWQTVRSSSVRRRIYAGSALLLVVYSAAAIGLWSQRYTM